MPEVNIGLIRKSLNTDARISTWKAVEDTESMLQYANESLTNSFSNTEIIWELSRGMSNLCYRELLNSGGVRNRELDQTYIRESFRDGVATAAATFWAIRKFGPYEGIYDPRFEVPDDFEPSSPGAVFMASNPDFWPIVSRLISIAQESAGALVRYDKDYDPYFTIGVGAEYGAQFMIELLALRHESLAAGFALKEIHTECRIPAIV